MSTRYWQAMAQMDKFKGAHAYRLTEDVAPFFHAGDVVYVAPGPPRPCERVLIRDGSHVRMIFWPDEGRPAASCVIGAALAVLREVEPGK